MSFGLYKIRHSVPLLQAAVQQRGSIIDATENNLTQSLSNSKDVVAKSKEQHKRCVELSIRLLKLLLLQLISYTFFVGVGHSVSPSWFCSSFVWFSLQ